MTVDARATAGSAGTQCIRNQWLTFGQKRGPRCHERAMPNSIYCRHHALEAWARVRGMGRA